MRWTTEALVVGAGPYGTSLSYELFCKRTPFVNVGHPFSLWRRHVLSSATLRSDVNASDVFSRDGRLGLGGYLRRFYDSRQVARLLTRRVPVPIFRDYISWLLEAIMSGSAGRNTP